MVGLGGEILGDVDLHFRRFAGTFGTALAVLFLVWLVMPMCLEKASRAPELNLEPGQQDGDEVEEDCGE